MNVKKFFEICAAKGIQEAQITINRSKNTSVKVFEHEIDSFTISDSQSVVACGIVNGKFGSAATTKLTKDTFEFLANEILFTASFNEKEETASIFKGSPKYRKGSFYKKELPLIPMEKKVAVLFEIEKALYASDPNVEKVDMVRYTESEHEEEFYNSFGLKLKAKGNYFSIVSGVVIRKGEEVKTFYDGFVDNDFSKFDKEKFVAEITKKCLAKFGGAPCNAGKYPTVLSREIVSPLLDAFLDACSAKAVQKNSSFLKGRLGTKVASPRLTVEMKPLAKTIYFSYFDSEGVAKSNRTVIRKGVLQTYFHNRETAEKDGVESTGNGTFEGGQMGVGYDNVFVKPGKKSFDEMIAPIQDGVYITEIGGLHAGLNEVSGDFSCQAEGFRIRNGKLAEPLNLITLSGNLLQMFADLKEFDNNDEFKGDFINVADAYIKEMSIGGQ